MRGDKLLLALAIVTASLFLAGPRAAAQETVLHNFGNGNDGASPQNSLTFDAAGDLYGTTSSGGLDKVGTVFELTPKSGGGWSYKILYSFSKAGGDGQAPWSGVIFDSAGNLYGTTSAGGANGAGTVFELMPPAPPSSQWTEKILYSFLNDGVDGQKPLASVVFDSTGNLYGTTFDGGTSGYGTVFELSPVGDGWVETLLHTFPFSGDGQNPRGSLILDSSGNVYGMTLFGGGGSGIVFELSPSSGGEWTEAVLHNFANGSDGGYPTGGLIFDSLGNLYGITEIGGATDAGTVFELSPSSGGSWSETILYTFGSKASDGSNPFGNLVFDSAGNLYGTAFDGGTDGSGTVFELKPFDGHWYEKTLYNFGSSAGDGNSPAAGVVLDSAGNLYGTCSYGGAHNVGTVFEIRR
jgi:uncharacterized repeat protein (TIGR03803 family)